MPRHSLAVVGLVLLAGAACRKDEPPAPRTTSTPTNASVTPAASAPPPFTCHETLKPAAPAVAGADAGAARPPRLALFTKDERAKLDAALKAGIVAVKYEPCGDLEIVPGCTIPGKYRYERARTKLERSTFDDAAALENGVLGVAAIEKKAGTAALTFDPARAGTNVADPKTDAEKALDGDACKDVTHVAVAFDLGTLIVTRTKDRELVTSAGAPLGCIGHLGAGGDAGAAAKPDAGPPEGCDHPIAVELVPRGDVAPRFAALRIAAALAALEVRSLRDVKGSPPGGRGGGGLGGLVGIGGGGAGSGSTGSSSTGSSNPTVHGDAPKHEILAPPQ